MSELSAIKTLIHSEKSSFQEEGGKYFFWVKKEANKIQVKQAIESLYKVDVEKVNTITMPGKAKRVRMQLGYTTDWKKAIVTLKKGQKIEVK